MARSTHGLERSGYFAGKPLRYKAENIYEDKAIRIVHDPQHQQVEIYQLTGGLPEVAVYREPVHRFVTFFVAVRDMPELPIWKEWRDALTDEAAAD